MNYEIEIINSKKLTYCLLIGLLLWVFIFVLMVMFKADIWVSIISLVLVPVLGLIFSMKSSTKTVDILLTPNQLEFGDIKIEFKNVLGYYINDETLLFTEIEMRDIDNNEYKITSFSYGIKGKKFAAFLKNLLEHFSSENASIKKLTFYDFHKTQYRIQKFMMPIDLALVIAINLTFLYFFIFDNMEFTWKILGLDIIFITFLIFYRRNKPTT